MTELLLLFTDIMLPAVATGSNLANHDKDFFGSETKTTAVLIDAACTSILHGLLWCIVNRHLAEAGEAAGGWGVGRGLTPPIIRILQTAL